MLFSICRLVQHLDDILPHCEVLPQQVAELLIEVFAGELARGSHEDTEKSVLSHVENIHLQINEKQIKHLLQIATKRRKGIIFARHLLKALLFIIRVGNVTRNKFGLHAFDDFDLFTSANALQTVVSE